MQSLWVWFQFGTCAAVIMTAGTLLSRYGDVIADKTGLSGSWIGLVLLATVTSLPELVTGISAVTLTDEPNLAVGNIFGSCVFNLALLVMLDFYHRQESVYRRASQGHILSAAFGIVLIGFAGQSILLGSKFSMLAVGHVGIYVPVIVLMYLVAMRSVFIYERAHMQESIEQAADRYPEMSLRQALMRYSAAAAVVVGASLWLPLVGARLAEAMGWHKTFFGTLFLALATSLPELVVTLAAMRIGALDMAISNLLGSNLFNILILAVNDLFYLNGPLLFKASPVHAISALSALVMAGLVIVGFLYRPNTRLFRTVGWISFGLLAIYILNTTILFLYGE